MSRDVRWFRSELIDLDLLRQGSCQSRRAQAESHPPAFLAEQVCLQVVKGLHNLLTLSAIPAD